MRLPIYQIDAFTDRVFSGNPAAVCPLDHWLDDAVMQAIAAENNCSETAFYVKEGEYYALRWFTPEAEVDLCGHATLGAAFVLFEMLGYADPCVVFETRSGRLFVERDADGRLSMDFPAWIAKPFSVTERIVDALGARPAEMLATRDFLAVFEDEDTVRGLTPDMRKVAGLDCMGLIATAPGREYDFVSRFFAPKVGIAEDPVTGSAHCTLTPYWSKRLGRHRLRAWQASARGGEVVCEHQGERVRIAGHAVCYLQGTIAI